MSSPSIRPPGFTPDFPLPSLVRPEFVQPNHPALEASNTLKLTDLPLEILALIASNFKNDWNSFAHLKLTSKRMREAANAVPKEQRPINNAKLLKNLAKQEKRKREENEIECRKKRRERDPNVKVLRNNRYYYTCPPPKPLII